MQITIPLKSESATARPAWEYVSPSYPRDGADFIFTQRFMGELQAGLLSMRDITDPNHHAYHINFDTDAILRVNTKREDDYAWLLNPGTLQKVPGYKMFVKFKHKHIDYYIFFARKPKLPDHATSGLGFNFMYWPKSRHVIIDTHVDPFGR